MSKVILFFALSILPLFACPDIEKTVKTYIEQNHGGEEEKPTHIEHTIMRVNLKVHAVQLHVPAESTESEDKTAAPKFQSYLLFFSGTTQCDFVYQADGEFTETLEAGSTKYVLVRTEDSDAAERHSNVQVLTVRANGEVKASHDQHGGEIYFSEMVQERCNGKVGDFIQWTRDKTEPDRITLRQRHTDRDEKCRIIEDASTYRYYRLTPEHWLLDDGADDTERPVVSKKSR